MLGNGHHYLLYQVIAITKAITPIVNLALLKEGHKWMTPNLILPWKLFNGRQGPNLFYPVVKYEYSDFTLLFQRSRTIKLVYIITKIWFYMWR